MKSLRINRKLFIEASGIDDERNSKKLVKQMLNGRFGEDDCIWYHDAFNLVVDMYRTGKIWMYPPEEYNRILIEHIDDWIGVGLITFDYKQ